MYNKSKCRVKNKSMFKVQATDKKRKVQNNGCSQYIESIEFMDIKKDNTDNDSVIIGENFRPNNILLANASLIPIFNDGTNKHISHMTENSFINCNEPTSQYKRKMILDMANSIVSESNTLTRKTQNEKEFRPYEEQTEFQTSSMNNKRIQQIAKDIVNKYGTDDNDNTTNDNYNNNYI